MSVYIDECALKCVHVYMFMTLPCKAESIAIGNIHKNRIVNVLLNHSL